MRFLVEAHAGYEVAANLEDERAASDRLDAIPPPVSARVRDDDQISGLDEPFRLNLDVEEFKEVLVEAHDLVRASVDVRGETSRRRPIHLYVGMIQSANCVQVAAVIGVDRAPDNFDVLLRHRPSSISRPAGTLGSTSRRQAASRRDDFGARTKAGGVVKLACSCGLSPK